MAKRKVKSKVIGWNPGNYCPDCGQKIKQVVTALPSYDLYVWFVYHWFTERKCYHIEDDMPLSLKLLLKDKTETTNQDSIVKDWNYENH